MAIQANLQRVLEATGFVLDGEPATGLTVGSDTQNRRPWREFSPDAAWRSPAAFTVYFKYSPQEPTPLVLDAWRREVWNEGFAPLLWVVSPARIQLFNGYGEPKLEGDAAANRIAFFQNIDSALRELDELAGRLSLETGDFWRKKPEIDRGSSVDQRLLRDLSWLEHDLVDDGLDRPRAQALIGRTIFTQYLIDRRIVSPSLLRKVSSYDNLPAVFEDRQSSAQLFTWLSDTFNGDMFPKSAASTTPKGTHLARIADFLRGTNPVSRQLSFFPYQFDVIPVELISAIYEQFAHSSSEEEKGRASAKASGVHYTRLSAVHLVLDEVMDGVTGDESVIDLTCGSGVFLVEAFRRLVQAKTRQEPISRKLIRNALYTQVFGVDQSESAVRVAAFSLYLAALELDPNPQPPIALTFSPLIGETLFVGDAFGIEDTPNGRAKLCTKDGLRTFDLIVGNPPWSFRGKAGTESRRQRLPGGVPPVPRGEALDFVYRAIDFSHLATRFGIILKATPFFAGSGTGVQAVRHLLRKLAPVTLVNLSPLVGWLFETATAPALVLYARHRKQPPNQITVVQVPWTAAGERTQSFEISPNDVIHLSLSDVESNPTKLKTAAVGRRRDLALVDRLQESLGTLGEGLGQLQTDVRDGLTRGAPRSQTRDARFLRGLEVVDRDDLGAMQIRSPLKTFDASKAQWPRSQATFTAPLIIVRESMGHEGRVLAAISRRDLVFTDAYFGISLPNRLPTAYLLAGILSSALTSWYLTMTAAEFGIWKRKLLLRDVRLLPCPDLSSVIESPVGQSIIRLVGAYHAKQREVDWEELDKQVERLYGLDTADSLIVRDGLVRAGWAWSAGRTDAARPARSEDLVNYANAFLQVVQGWLSVTRDRHMRAEVLQLSPSSPLRIVRFVLESGEGSGTVEPTDVDDDLKNVLSQIGTRLKVKIANALTASRELRVHGRNELYIIKPSERRYWMNVRALDDADAVIAESISVRANVEAA